MLNEKALILGVTGQDGSYTAELLLKKIIKFLGYLENLRQGIKKFNQCIKNKNLKLVQGDVTDPISLDYIIDKCKPDEI